jgi:NAD+ kinase
MLSLTETSKEALLVVDGQYRCDLQVGDTVEIRRAPVTFKLAKLPGRSYYTTLQRKLGWSGQPLYPGRR